MCCWCVKSVIGNLAELDVYVRVCCSSPLKSSDTSTVARSCLRLHEIPEHSHESVRERVKVDVEFAFYSIISDWRLGAPEAWGGVGIVTERESGGFWKDSSLGSGDLGFDKKYGSRLRLTVNVVFRVCLVGLVVVDHLYHLE